MGINEGPTALRQTERQNFKGENECVCDKLRKRKTEGRSQNMRRRKGEKGRREAGEREGERGVMGGGGSPSGDC